MRVFALIWVAAALALPLAAPGGQPPVQLVLHSKPDAGLLAIKYIHAPHVPSPPPPLHVQPPPPPPPPASSAYRLPPELRLPTKQRLSAEYAEPDRPRSPDLVYTENATEPDADDTDVSLCITVAGLAALAGDAPEQGEVRLCMVADTSPARRVYNRLARAVAQHPAWTQSMDLARTWASVVHQTLVDAV
ncbi:hypothetical protein CspeluHIS016_0101610 [Cutaneotrichosporon spelunceum]|uniref:Uncharacterized protein n=1 Tax=Cutaneotrichosporon spelunceum TaxID=1672016 RepID=A0AAD3TNL0_9TREE|nr:hypothetical protein CspeluHIS016_0101610 [Cutaneotrichosporon spelunceum]